MNQHARSALTVAITASLLIGGCNAESFENQQKSRLAAVKPVSNSCKGELKLLSKWEENHGTFSLTSCLTADTDPSGEYHLKEYLNLQLQSDQPPQIIWQKNITTSVELNSLIIPEGGVLIKDINNDQQQDFALVVAEVADGDDPVIARQIAYISGKTSIREASLPRTQDRIKEYSQGKFNTSFNAQELEQLNASWVSFLYSWYDADEMAILAAEKYVPEAMIKKGGSHPASNSGDLQLRDFGVEISQCTATALDIQSLMDNYENSVKLMKRRIGTKADFAGRYYFMEFPSPKGGIYTYGVVNCITGKQVASLGGYYTQYDPDNNDNGFNVRRLPSSRLLIIDGYFGNPNIGDKPEDYQTEYYEMINDKLVLLKKTPAKIPAPGEGSQNN